MNNEAHQELIPIRELSSMTGVNSVTIRAWERRYGLIKPQRTPKGHRLYSHDDVALIQDIQKWLDKGVAISKVKDLLKKGEDLHIATDDQWHEHIQKTIQAIEGLQQNKLESIFRDLSASYPSKTLWTHWARPINAEYRNHLDAFSTRSKIIFWQKTLFEKLSQIVKSQANECKNNVLLVSLDEAALELELAFIAWQLAEAGIKSNMAFLSIPEKEIPFVSETLKIPAIVLHCSKSLNQSRLDDIHHGLKKTEKPIFLIGDAVDINTTEIKQTGLIPVTTPENLIEKLKELFE